MSSSDDAGIVRQRMLDLESKLYRAEAAIDSAKFELSKSFSDLAEAKYTIDQAKKALERYRRSDTP